MSDWKHDPSVDRAARARIRFLVVVVVLAAIAGACAGHLGQLALQPLTKALEAPQQH